MSERIFSNGLLLFGGIDLTAQIRETALVLSADAQDVTALNDTARNRLGGLKDVALSAAGYFSAAEPDASLFSGVGVADKLITVCPTTTPGDPDFFFRAVVGEFAPITGAVGEVLGFSLNAASYLGDLIRGTLMENSTRAATGNGTGRQLGAVASGQSAYFALHVTANSGSWSVTVQSDDNSGFTTPTTRATFSSITTTGQQYASAPGPITDTWWRYVFTRTSGSITSVGSIGIQ